MKKKISWLEMRLFQKENRCKLKPASALICLCLMAILFTVLTFFPPEIPFFQDPITGTYGYY